MENIIVINKEELERKIKLMKEDGKDQLHVLSDFDKTLTKAFINGKIHPSIISELRNKNYLSEEFSKKAHDLYAIYHPMEIDPNLSFKEKFDKMTERWATVADLLIHSGLNKSHIQQVVNGGDITFRDGALDCLALLHEKNIPLVVISASGIGDAIPLYFQKNNALTDNVGMVTNFFDRDQYGNAIGHSGPIIHTLNKSEVALHEFPFYAKVKGRKNVILLGDTLEDPLMIGGFEYKNLIKIGFLNENVDKQLEFFKQKYDVIILNDGNMDYVNEIVRKIV